MSLTPKYIRKFTEEDDLQLNTPIPDSVNPATYTSDLDAFSIDADSDGNTDKQADTSVFDPTSGALVAVTEDVELTDADGADEKQADTAVFDPTSGAVDVDQPAMSEQKK